MTTPDTNTANLSINQTGPAKADLVCFAHLRWEDVKQRPHHLMERFGRERRVFYYEEARIDPGSSRLVYREAGNGVFVVTPHVPETLDWFEKKAVLRALLDQLLEDKEIEAFTAWYYTPRAWGYSDHLNPITTIYDCMDDLASFNGAPKDMSSCERLLLNQADLVFTGGYSLYESRKDTHPNVYAFPSSVDTAHFMRARSITQEPEDQARIPHPRLGYYGVIDERIDYALIEAAASAHPEWQIIMVGPFAKVEPELLPRHKNIHYLGKKPYADLPAYLSGWDAAMLPFAVNRATKFISPTKTPEYLAGGKPVVSTPITDVVKPYGEDGLIRIARTTEEFIRAIENILKTENYRQGWLEKVDKYLADHSWDKTWARMSSLVEEVIQEKLNPEPVSIGTAAVEDTAATISLPPMYIETTSPRADRRGKLVYDFLVVGAGFAGSVLAERLARGSGKRVLLVDRRNHIGGNAYDTYDDAGLLIHKYGPHIFHTNSRDAFAYLSQFTKWRPYEHRVRASVDGQLLPLPINLDTVNRLYGTSLSSFELEKFFLSVAEKTEKIRTSEDVVVSKVGREIYEKFFRNYTRKQWDLDPSELDSSVTSRVPIRLNRDDRYFTDTYQAMPLHGYTRMFENMLDHPNIHILLKCDYRDVVNFIDYKEVIYTGPIDEFFGFVYGKLPYRSLKFRFETLEKERHQEVAVINYPNEHPYTRVTEFKHLTGQVHPKTSLVYEYPCSEGDPYYPIPRPENAELYKKYKEMAEAAAGVHFCGRLATYKYYNMDQVTAQALSLYARLSGLSKTDALSAHTSSSFSIEMPCHILVDQEN